MPKKMENELSVGVGLKPVDLSTNSVAQGGRKPGYPSLPPPLALIGSRNPPNLIAAPPPSMPAKKKKPNINNNTSIGHIKKENQQDGSESPKRVPSVKLEAASDVQLEVSRVGRDVLLRPGPFITIREVMRYSVRFRKRRTLLLRLFYELEEMEMGTIVNFQNSVVFCKAPPMLLNRAALLYVGITFEEYLTKFLLSNQNLSPRMKESLVMLSPYAPEAYADVVWFILGLTSELNPRPMIFFFLRATWVPKIAVLNSFKPSKTLHPFFHPPRLRECDAKENESIWSAQKKGENSFTYCFVLYFFFPMSLHSREDLGVCVYLSGRCFSQRTVFLTEQTRLWRSAKVFPDSVRQYFVYSFLGFFFYNIFMNEKLSALRLSRSPSLTRHKLQWICWDFVSGIRGIPQAPVFRLEFVRWLNFEGMTRESKELRHVSMFTLRLARTPSSPWNLRILHNWRSERKLGICGDEIDTTWKESCFLFFFSGSRRFSRVRVRASVFDEIGVSVQVEEPWNWCIPKNKNSCTTWNFQRESHVLCADSGFL